MRITAAIVAIVILGLASGAAASAAGYGPFAGVADDLPATGGQAADGSSGGSSSGASGSGGGSGSTGGGTGGDATPQPRSFTIAVVSIDECGETCRDVTLRVTNEQNRTATGVAVDAVIFAGKSTDEGDEVWADSTTVGELGPSASVDVTRRVELGVMDAATIKRADGWVTVRTTVRSDGAAETFTEHKKVA